MEIKKAEEYSSEVLCFVKVPVKDFFISDSRPEKIFIFIGCKINNMKILQSNTSKAIIFLGCRIYKLQVELSFIPNMQFVSSNIDKSSFKNSKLRELKFLNQLTDISPETAQYFNEQDLEKKETCTIADSTFIFCQLNQMYIEYTRFVNSVLKHCCIEKMKAGEDVKIERVDIRGSHFYEADWCDLRFDKITFSKGFFLTDFFEILLRLLSRLPLSNKIIIFFFPLKPNNVSKRVIEEEVAKSFLKFRQNIKKRLYNLRFLRLFRGRWIIDRCSTTIVKESHYNSVDFSKANSFYWYIEELDHIDKLKEKSLPFVAISYILVGHMRSIRMLLFRVAIFTLLFGIFYCSCADFKSGHSPFLSGTPITKRLKPSNLSIRVLINAEKSPLETGNYKTEIVIFMEKGYGYISLGALLAILVYYFTRPTSSPKRNNQKKLEKKPGRRKNGREKPT